MDEKSEELIAAELRVLGLVDRVLGLEAEIAYLKSSPNKDLWLVHQSITWKVGAFITAPARSIRKLIRRKTSA
jgi:hypothetical protein